MSAGDAYSDPAVDAFDATRCTGDPTCTCRQELCDDWHAERFELLMRAEVQQRYGCTLPEASLLYAIFGSEAML